MQSRSQWFRWLPLLLNKGPMCKFERAKRMLPFFTTYDLMNVKGIRQQNVTLVTSVCRETVHFKCGTTWQDSSRVGIHTHKHMWGTNTTAATLLFILICIIILHITSNVIFDLSLMKFSTAVHLKIYSALMVLHNLTIRSWWRFMTDQYKSLYQSLVNKDTTTLNIR